MEYTYDVEQLLVNDLPKTNHTRKYQIFISYRREGGEFLGKVIYDKLTERNYDVFYDVESMRSGKFNEQLFNVISECDDFIILLSPNALDRCSNPDDWVLKEISYALGHNKNVIPIQMRGFEWPLHVPKEIEKLKMYEAIMATNEYIDSYIDKLSNDFLVSKKKVQFEKYVCSSEEIFDVKTILPIRLKKNSNDIPHLAVESILINAYQTDNHIRENTLSIEQRELIKNNIDYLYELKNKVQYLKKYKGSTYFISAFALYTIQLNYYIPKDFLDIYINISSYLLNISDKCYLSFFKNTRITENAVNLFKKHLPIPFDVLISSKSKNISPEFRSYCILLFECMIDLYLFIFNNMGENNCTLAIRQIIRSYYNSFRKKKIFMPEFIQKKIYDL